jgi:hypothetical protein
VLDGRGLCGLGADGGSKKRMQLDRSLMATLVNRWCSEMHTFYLLCEDMTLTLQDVSYLLGLPIAEAVR